VRPADPLRQYPLILTQRSSDGVDEASWAKAGAKRAWSNSSKLNECSIVSRAVSRATRFRKVSMARPKFTIS
jgi:hypothetical protein